MMASQMLLPGVRRRASKRDMRAVIKDRLEVARPARLLRAAERKRRRAAGPVVDVRDLVQQRLVDAVGEDEAAAMLAAAVFSSHRRDAEDAEGAQRS